MYSAYREAPIERVDSLDREREDIATIAGGESGPTAWATLRARSTGQDITCQLLF